MEHTMELDQQYVAPTYARFPLEIISGQGALLKGADGKDYIDLGSGIAVNTFGMCDAAWISAVSAQLNRFQHTSNLYYTQPCAELAKQICLRTGMKKVFFSNSGAEANECAIKAARKYAAMKKGSNTYTILTLKNSFHGRTITTLAATGQDVFHHDFLPLTDGFVYAEANDIESVRALVQTHKIAGIFFEPVQGEGGVLPMEADFVRGLAEIATEQDILLMVDEVQTGNGRTGKLYGYMHYGIMPDIVTTAKGLGGGLPIGVTMLGEKVKDVYTPGDHGSTFGGNPVVCAGALSIFSRLDDAFLEGVRAKSAHIFKTLTGAPGILGVSGMGLMIGLKTKRLASEVVAACLEQGVLVLKAKNKVRLLPPLNIDMALLDKALQVLCRAAADV